MEVYVKRMAEPRSAGMACCRAFVWHRWPNGVRPVQRWPSVVQPVQRTAEPCSAGLAERCSTGTNITPNRLPLSKSDQPCIICTHWRSKGHPHERLNHWPSIKSPRRGPILVNAIKPTRNPETTGNLETGNQKPGNLKKDISLRSI